MAAKQSPFFNINYGWAYNEDGWNVGMDENLTKLSFLGYKIVKDVVASLPSGAVDGDSYILSTNKTVYFMVDSQWNQITPSEGMSVYVVSYGYAVTYKDGDWTGSSSPSTSGTTLKLAFIGDSLTQTSARNLCWPTQLGWFLEQLLGVDVLVKNAAIGGSTFDLAMNTNQHSGGTKTQVQEVIEFAPDIVFVSLGINDMIYASAATSAQVISTATAMKNALKAALPNVKIIYVEELTYDTSSGLSPSSLQNQQTVPFSHQTITLKGLTNVRINNSTYLTTSISSASLTRCQTWATATATLRTLFDGYCTANLWKMALLGCMIDPNHVNELGQTMWAWGVVKYLSTSGLSVKSLNFSKLNFSNITSQLFDIDVLYTQAIASSQNANSVALFRGENIFENMAGWMYANPTARMDYGTALKDGSIPQQIGIYNVKPNSAVYVAWDGIDFVSSGRNTTPQGVHIQTFIPSAAFPTAVGAGPHTVWYAVANGDGTYDAFTGTVTIQNNTSSVTKSALRYATSDITDVPTDGTVYTLSLTGTDIDEIGIGSSFDRLIVPSSINGKKIKINGNVRIRVPVSSASGTVDVYAGFQKNGVAGAGNVTGRGLGSARQSSTNVTGATDFDLNFASAALTASTSDYYSVLIVVYASSGTASGTATIVGNIYTWMEMEVLP